MSEAAKHYELPWTLDEFKRDGAAWGYIVSRHGTIVCEIAGILDSCGNRENAEFIVRAVNSHADMLASLKEMVRLVDAVRFSITLGETQSMRLLRAKDLIARAESTLPADRKE